MPLRVGRKAAGEVVERVVPRRDRPRHRKRQPSFPSPARRAPARARSAASTSAGSRTAARSRRCRAACRCRSAASRSRSARSSRRCAALPIKSCGDGRPRASPARCNRRSAKSRASPPASRDDLPERSAIRSSLTGTAISAAAVGVAGAPAPAWSIRSCRFRAHRRDQRDQRGRDGEPRSPRLNAIKSSRPPLPRHDNQIGPRQHPPSGRRSNRLDRRRNLGRRPFARTPQPPDQHAAPGNLSASRCRMSRMTAPVGEVTTPITSGRNGSGFSRSAANSPSAGESLAPLVEQLSSAPTPATRSCR